MAKILDPNINKIKFFRSKTVGAIPAVGDLDEGEIAINLADRTIYSKRDNAIVDIGFGKGGNVTGTINTTEDLIASKTVKGKRMLSESFSITTSTGQGNGLALYGDDYSQNGLPSYGAAFAVSSKFGGHGAVAGNDWATYFTMAGGANRGWIFKQADGTASQGNVASISSGGVATFAKVVAPIEGNADTATRLNKTLQVLGSEVPQWYMIATLDVPQSGKTMWIDYVGGNGFNAIDAQQSSARIIFKTSNGQSGNVARIKAEIIDSNETIKAVALKNTGGSVYELYAFMGAYPTGYLVYNYPKDFNWVNVDFNAFGTTDPNGIPVEGAVRGSITVLAKIDSNVASATKLQTPRAINGTLFDGTGDINIQNNSSIRIPAGADLNAYLTPGNYYCDYDSDAATIANKPPFEGSFALTVEKTAGFIQKYTHYNSGRTWVRKSYLGFSAWREYVLLDESNWFSKSQFISAGVSSAMTTYASGEAAFVMDASPGGGRRVVLSSSTGGNGVGLYDGIDWLFRSPRANEFNLHAHTTIMDGKAFRMAGTEGDNIDRVQNPNGAITINSPEQGMASIRNALSFNWYSSAFQIGAIRSGSQASHGLGFTLGNNDLLARIHPDGSFLAKRDISARNGSLFAPEGGLEIKWDSTANSHISRSGRFAAPTTQYHYIDVGQDGRDLMTFASYTGNYEWIDPAGGEKLMQFDKVNGLRVARQLNLTGVSPSDTIQNLGMHRGELNANGAKPDSWSVGYVPVAHATLLSTSGYRQHAVFGAYKASNDWTFGGAFIAYGGVSDNYPSNAFYFGPDSRGGSFIQNTTGEIRTDSTFIAHNNLHVGGELHVSGMIKTAAPYLQFLKPDGSERAIAVGAMLVSDTYADFPNVPGLGIYTKGQIRTNAGFTLPNSPGGENNGMFPGNGDSASWDVCNWDIKSHWGLGFKTGDGVRRIVFDLRNGVGNFQGSVNVAQLNSSGSINATGAINSTGPVMANGGLFTGAYRFGDVDGYTTLPNGAILQWGRWQIDYDPGEIAHSVTFPMRFPNACVSFTANRWQWGHASDGDIGVNVTSLSPTGAALSLQRFNGAYTAARGYSWIAIGY